MQQATHPYNVKLKLQNTGGLNSDGNPV